MECNRDEANRAKEIAERKFTARDVVGAKKFALKAQNLFPGLEGISQMLSTLDVHLSGDNKIGDEADWYGILGVNPKADDDTVRKKYRKLALMLHPDKNKSIGAEGAFKLISEAWSLLSDKTKRTMYDQRRSLKTSQQKVPSASGVSSATPPGANGFHNFPNPSSNVKAHKTTTKAAAAPAPASAPAPAPPRHSKPNTFWTACHRCKMQYEYLRVYQNHKLLCPNCHEPFLAVETQAPPVNASNASGHWQPPKQRQNSNHNSNKSSGGSGRKSSSSAANMGSDPSNQSKWSPFSGTASGGSATASAAAAAQAASVVQQAYEKVKREREEAQAAGRRQEALRKKNTHGSKRTASNSGAGTHDMKAKRRRNGDENAGKQTTSGAGMASGSGIMRNFLEKDRANSLPNSTRDLSQLELRNMLIEKARRQICKKLDECKSAAAGMATEKEKGKPEVIKDRKKEGVEVKETASVEVDASDQSKGVESVDVNKLSNGSPSIDTDSVVSETVARNTMSITVPDPDFHDFDRDRCEKCFGTNQVWAAYDDDDGMPRYYAIIHKVISVNPFKMRISWLNSKTNTELGPLNWTGSGFSKTCGDFRVGKHEFNSSLNSFSHKVRWTKGPRGVVIIFPKKGDVWAVYRNWSPDWNELTPDEVIHKYDMVEVLEDYTEDQGVVVIPLVKVAGFKTVFHRHLNTREVRNIHREEMFRFSHQVPSCLLTGSEAPGAPKGCRELDPAATPVELLQIVTEAKEEMVDTAEEETKAKHREVDVVEIVEEEITVDTKEKMVPAGENEENVVEIVKEEMMMEAKEKMIIEDSKETDVMEIVDQDIELPEEEDVMEIVEDEIMILGGEGHKTKDYNSSRNRMIRSLFEQEEDTIEIAVEEMMAEVKEKEIIDEEEEPMEEHSVEIPDVGEPKEEKVSKNAEKQRAGDDMEGIIKETEEEIVKNVSDQLKDAKTGEEVTPEPKDNQSMKNREQQRVSEAREEMEQVRLRSSEEMAQSSVV
ncbi:hypothetical protein C5167_007087 [Papaver somniferum]|uniref:J domain-containing protein n=1 Tax=Papaver somniferum TaxID=3469 RepID=A0A4Y7JJ52_PAPSO|nr:uncharacterized protein LOC113271687 [Papaver somniferum]XP_026377373.1 uncharacterized protein LOC113271687 [Papaver somniferum]RZC59789.1 hypothetical protein C5167_007087 [Papaver somniferum]